MIMHLSMFDVLSIFLHFICMYMFMGLVARMFSILFIGRRVGDVTIWYQSYRLQHGPEWAIKDQLPTAQKKLGENR